MHKTSLSFFILLATAVSLVASPVVAQTSEADAASQSSTVDSPSDQKGGVAGHGEPCDYHVDCASGHVCVRGVCVKSANALDVVSANDACGQDRRCRLERLKRKNRARRHARKLEEEQYAESVIEQNRQNRIEDRPRLDRPLVVDVRGSRLGILGLTAGYTLFGKLRPELQFVYWNAYVSATFRDDSYSGQQPMTFFMPGLTWFFMESEFVPYASASFVYATGTFDQNTYSFSPVGQQQQSVRPAEVDTEYHAVELQAGVDYQMEKKGAHLRLGLAYRPLIYNQARIDPGTYADQTRGALTNWYKQMVRIDVIVLAGWAF